jgi:nucleoside-diphosphate-sugar epimerase
VKKVFLTGSSGFVGRATCRQVVRQGFAATGALRKHTEQPADVAPVIVGEITGGTNWGDALNRVDVVVHLAARVHVMHETAADPLKAFRTVNVEGTLNLAKLAKVAGVKRFLFLSSIGVNGSQTSLGKPFSEKDIPQPHNSYAISKWEAEQGLMRIAEETGLEVVIIRSPLVYGFSAPGNFGSLMRGVQRGWPLPLGAVHNQRSFVALDNLVDFIVNCITHPQAANQTFLVSDGEDLSTPDLIRRMACAMNRTARLLPVPVWALKAGASLLGKGDAVQRLCGNLQVDISKSRTLLGWNPPISVDEGLSRAVGGG